MRWLTALQDDIRKGKNAFVLTGGIGDGFPVAADGPNDDLRPWHVIATAALRAARPAATVVTYDAALGFDFPDSHAEKCFIAFVKGKEKPEEKKRRDGEDDDIAKIREQMRQKAQGKLPVDFADASGAILKAFTNAAIEGKQLVVLMHDVDAAWMGGAGGEVNERLRAFLLLKRFAENDALQQAGHVLALSSPSMQSLPETFRRTDSPFTVIAVDRPDEDERLRFFRTACQSPDVSVEEDAGDQEAEPQPPKPVTTRVFDPDLWAKHVIVNGALAGADLTEKSWKSMKPGDALHMSPVDDLDPQCFVIKVMLRKGTYGHVLSKSKDLLQPLTKDGKTASYVYDAKRGPMQRWDVKDASEAPFVKEGLRATLRVIPKSIVDRFIEELDAKTRAEEAASLVQVNDPAPVQKPAFVPYEIPSCGIETAARITCGMSFRDIRRTLLAARGDGRGCTEADILEARRAILNRSFGHLFEFVEPTFGFEGIAGCDHVKELLLDARDKIAAGELVRVPMGLLLMGPPGTGKTAIAEASAREFGYLFVKIRNVRNMYVGETERQMEEVTAALRQLAPVVVFRDEVDQEDSGRDTYQGDSGVSARMRQTWMNFLADSKIRGRVFVISATNRPDLLDAALKRSGRTDERVALTMPDDATRSALLDVMFRRASKGLTNLRLAWDVGDTRANAVASTDGLSGADIEVVARHAIDYAEGDNGIITVEPRHLFMAIKNFIPSDAKHAIAKMELAAISACSRHSHRPKGWESLVAQHLATLGRIDELPQYVPDAAD